MLWPAELGGVGLKHGNLIKTCLILLIILSIAAVVFQCRQKSEHNTIIPESETEHKYPEKEVTLSKTEKEESREESRAIESSEAESRYLETATYPEDETYPEEIITPETYEPYGETALECYFTNTDMIDTADALPLYAHASMVEKTQKFLNDQGITARELYCVDDSIVHNGKLTSFQVRCVDAGNQIITMTYDRDSKTWTFSND